MVLVREDEEAPHLGCTQSAQALVDALVLVLHLVKHDRQDDDIFHCIVLQKVHLRGLSGCDRPCGLTGLKGHHRARQVRRRVAGREEGGPCDLLQHNVGVHDEVVLRISRQLDCRRIASGVQGGAVRNVISEVMLPFDLHRACMRFVSPTLSTPPTIPGWFEASAART